MEKQEERPQGEQKSVVNHFEAGANCQVFNGNITGCVFAMSGSTVNQQPTVQTSEPERSARAVPDVSLLLACVSDVRSYFWSDSSLAIVFCVCRDSFGYTGSMSQFERDFDCATGTLSNAFRNNPYMRLPVGKWAQNGAKLRVLRLADAYREAVEKRLED
jgi:hypothetical protein